MIKNLSIHGNYTWKNIKKSYKNKKFKISVPTWTEEFELPYGSYSVSDIQDCFEYIFKKHERVTDNPSIRIYINKVENRITFKIKTGHYFELLMPELMKLLEGLKVRQLEMKMVKMCLVVKLLDSFSAL